MSNFLVTTIIYVYSSSRFSGQEKNGPMSPYGHYNKERVKQQVVGWPSGLRQIDKNLLQLKFSTKFASKLSKFSQSQFVDSPTGNSWFLIEFLIL